jgi:CRISPR-associated protein Cas1
MIKQTLMFSNPVSLTLKDLQMVITFKDNKDTVTRPIEDIGFVIIENPMVSITIPLLNALADNNVSVVFCDKNRCLKLLENALSLTTASLLKVYKGETDKLSLPMIT